MAARFTLQEFSEIFQIRNPAGQLYVLVGGQAVNYWAERYLSTEADLAKLRPFTSQDIDFCGNREDVRHIAAQLRLTPVFPPKIAITALAGAIPFRVAEQETNIEIVRMVPGLTTKALEALAVEMEWKGKRIRVLDPISLLICKVELALTISQQNRQDVEHLKILTFCVRGFLRELLAEVDQGNVPAKAWLGAVNRLLKLSASARGRQAEKKYHLEWLGILPHAEIKRCKNSKIVMFREKQLAGLLDRK